MERFFKISISLCCPAQFRVQQLETQNFSPLVAFDGRGSFMEGGIVVFYYTFLHTVILSKRDLFGLVWHTRRSAHPFLISSLVNLPIEVATKYHSLHWVWREPRRNLSMAAHTCRGILLPRTNLGECCFNAMLGFHKPQLMKRTTPVGSCIVAFHSQRISPRSERPLFGALKLYSKII